MSALHRKAVIVLLLFFGVWDALLAGVCLFFPDLWFEMIHGAEYVDPQALLRRTGAVWAAFSVFHFIAFFLWRKHSYWLVIVGGMRLAEIFADWTYLFAAQDITTNGTISLVLATPSNLFVSWLFVYGFVKLTREAT